MALAALIKREGWDALSEDMRKEYKENGEGTFLLDVTPVDGHSLENTSGLRSSLEVERQSVRELKEQLKTFKDIDPDKARANEYKIKEMENWTPEQKVKDQVESQIAEVVKKHEGTIAEKDALFATLKAQLQNQLVTSEVTKAISEAKGSIPLLLPSIAKNVRMMRKDDGTFYAEVINAEGIARVDQKGEPMSIASMVEEFRNDTNFARAFDGSGKSGSDARPSTTQEGVKQPIPEKIDPVARLRMAHERKGT